MTRDWPGRFASVAVITVVVAAAVGLVGARDTAGATLDTCDAQQSAAAQPTPTPAPTAAPTATPSARPGAAGRRARRAARRRNQQAARRRQQQQAQRARTAQLPEVESGAPRAVDPEGKPIAGAVELAFPFGREREPMTRLQAFQIPADMSLAAVTATVPFQDVTDEDGRPLAPSHLRAIVSPTGPGRVVTLSVCLDPDEPSEMRAGTYTGTALVGVGERFTSVTLEATVQDDRWLLILLFPLAGVVAGLFVRLFADQQSTDHIKRFRDVSKPRVIATVGAGLVVAFYSYRTIYLDDPTFYAGAGDLWRLTAETFAGTLAAKTLTDLAGQQRETVAEATAAKPTGNATQVTITT